MKGKDLSINKMTEKKPTPEEREKAREVALKNLGNSPLMDLAAAYLVNASGKYGEAGDSAIEQFKYFPAMQSEEGSKLVMGGLLGSRQDGKRYTGNVSEYKIISDCAQIMQESLATIKVQDILDLIGSDVKLKEAYRDKYLTDLAESGKDEDKELVGKILGGYQTYFIDAKVAEALGERTKATKSGLEEILKEPEKKK